ncbi:unnamed protein product [Rhizopus stolonifer]
MEIDIVTDDCISETDTVLNTPTLFRRSSSKLYQVVDHLERRVQVLSEEIQHHVQREIALESELLLLKQKQPTIKPYVTQYKSSPPDLWHTWTGKEISNLFDSQQDNSQEDNSPENDSQEEMPALLFRLKSSIRDHLPNDTYQMLLDQLETHLDHLASREHENRMREQDRVGRLLNALHISLEKNRMLETDISFILKQQTNKTGSQKQLETKHLYKAQIKQLQQALSTCQEERDEFEMTVEIVRREMETMLEELEDTREQKLRFKNQASRLKAGLEAVRQVDDEQEIDSVQLLLNEAERRATDIDRECKRQALALKSVRKELKEQEENHLGLALKMKREIADLLLTKEKMARKIELLALSDRSDEIDVCGLQTALKAAKTEGVIQRARVHQLEKNYQQQLKNLNQCLADLKEIFNQELSKRNDQCIHREFMKTVEKDQEVWKETQLKEFQKKREIDMLEAHRAIRYLSGQIIDLEDELESLEKRHKSHMHLERQQLQEDYNKKTQRLSLHHQLKQVYLNKNIDILIQKNQTLEILYLDPTHKSKLTP